MTASVEQTDLPPYRHWGPCARCGGRGPIRVHFDRDCAEARGDHFHRVRPCGYERLERLPAGVGGNGARCRSD